MHIFLERENVGGLTVDTRDILKKIKALIILRAVLITGAVAAGALVLQVERTPFYYIIAALYLATFIYAVLIKINFSPYIHALIQIVTDIILETFIIYYTGGAGSVYAFLYAPSIIAAGIVISGAAAKTAAGTASLAYGLAGAAEWLGIIHPVPGEMLIYSYEGYTMLFIISFRIVIFCLVGYLSGYLSQSLTAERVELKRLRSLSDIILRNVSSGVVTIDVNGRIIFANPAAKVIFGLEDKRILHRQWEELFLGHKRKDTADEFREKAKMPAGLEVNISLHGRTGLVLRCTYTDIKDEKGMAIGAVITFVDLTHIKQLEIEARQRERLSTMGETALSMAHEIRNPLAAVRGALEVLKGEGAFRGGRGHLIDVVFKESDRLNRIIEDFLKYGKDTNIIKKHTDIKELIDNVWLLARQDRRWHKGIQLAARVGGGGIRLKIDPDKIKQVLYNIIINAVEALREGGKIDIDVEDERDRVKIKVTDNGCGIDASCIRDVFSDFYSTKKSGTGIGLAITKRIVEAHNGAVYIESALGEGTTVTVILPKG